MRARRTDRLTLPGVLSHLGVMVVVSIVLGVLVAGLAMPFAGTLGLAARSSAESLDSLPAELEAEPLAQRSRMLAKDGSVIATFYDENRVNIPLDQVAPVMKDAILAIEDSRFYEHGALDLQGTLRAFIRNQAGGTVQGGSSITQQMVKMTLISQADSVEERRAAQADTYERKINELRYAIAFEEKYDKDWILERYLNIAYFGDGAYGVESAARHYFSRPASKLTLPQAALLAGLVKNPVGYDPTSSPEAARGRRDLVLSVMAEQGMITPQQAEVAKSRGLRLRLSATRNGCLSSTAPFFCDYVVEYLKQDADLGDSPDARMERINSGGLTIQTTMDPRFQKAAEKAATGSVRATDQAIGAVAMVEPQTGEVRGLGQSRPMGRNAKKGETFLNYVVDQEYGDAAGFQPGSTFKAFVLASAINDKVPLNTQINAPQDIAIPMRNYEDCDGPYASTDVWEVSNSTGSGTFDLYSGTQKSVNTFFAQLELRTGLCEPYALARQMGIALNNPEIERVPSFTLGVADVSPLEMASAYGVFAARGLACERRPVLSVRDDRGKLIKDWQPNCKQVMPKGTADAVNDILRGVQEPGGFGYSNGVNLSQPSAGKTGTTNSNRAVWFVGYTPTMATASVIAGANQKGQPQSLAGQYINGRYISADLAAGSTLAGPQWRLAMGAVEHLLPDRDFVPPSGTVVEGVQVEVPDTYGMSQSQAAAVLRRAGFSPVIGPLVDSGYSYGEVAYTYPGRGSEIGSGSSVTIYVSDGSPYVAPQPQPQPRPDRPGNGNGNGGGGGGGGGNGNGGGNGRGGD